MEDKNAVMSCTTPPPIATKILSFFIFLDKSSFKKIEDCSKLFYSSLESTISVLSIGKSDNRLPYIFFKSLSKIKKNLLESIVFLKLAKLSNLTL